MKSSMIPVASMAVAMLLSACRAVVSPDAASLRAEVMAAERAFAATMAHRDLQAFGEFLDEDAVFFSATDVQRGREAVIAAWKPFFAAPQPSFSWTPEQVELAGDGSLALSTGPVFDARGEPIGSFSTLWRRQGTGVWKVVFDKGCNACRCAQPGTSAADDQSTSS